MAIRKHMGGGVDAVVANGNDDQVVSKTIKCLSTHRLVATVLSELDDLDMEKANQMKAQRRREQDQTEKGENGVESSGSGGSGGSSQVIIPGPGFEWLCSCGWRNKSMNGRCGGLSTSHGCGSEYEPNAPKKGKKINSGGDKGSSEENNSSEENSSSDDDNNSEDESNIVSTPTLSNDDVKQMTRTDAHVRNIFNAMPANGLLIVCMQGGIHTSKQLNTRNELTPADNAVVGFAIRE
jgi:hypothetical protein